MAPRTSAAGPRLPLLITNDEDLLEELLRLAAAGRVEAEVAPDPIAARAHYLAAPLVLVGLDQAHSCLSAHLPRRPQVAIVGHTGRDLLPQAPPDVAPDTLACQYANLLGAEHVAMLPAAEAWLVDRFVDCGRDPAGGGRVVAVIGGRGGAGASVLAAGLAVTGVRAGLRTLLVDADPLGGGLDLVLGWEDVHGLRWPALTGASGRVDAPALVEALPGRGELVVLSWDRGEVLATPAESMEAAMDAGRRGRDLVVVDLPRRLDDAAVVALEAADRTLLVVPAELRAAAAANRVAAAVRPHCPDISLVIRGPAPSNLTAAVLTEAINLPLAGALRPEPGLARALERGEPPACAGRGPLAALCRRIVDDLIGTPRPAAPRPAPVVA